MGNLRQEAGRFSFTESKGGNTSDHECVSPNESEPVSASLHQMSAAKLPETMKPVTCGEEMSICSHRALRGDRGERAQKDVQRNLGDPFEQVKPELCGNQ